MRGKTKPAEGTIVSAQPSGKGGVYTSKKGEKREYELVVDVRPGDEPQFRAVVTQRSWRDVHPRPGDVVRVSIREKDRRVEIDIDDDPRYQPPDPDQMRQITQLGQTVLQEMTSLQATGVAAEATVGSVVEHPLPAQMQDRSGHFDISVSVRAPDGSTFPGAFPLFFPKANVPKVGESIWVSYDPDNPSYVRFRPGGNPAAQVVQNVRWRVPEICPSCGARVDQSFASSMAHPKCRMCESPLPCEPLPSA
jgi:hypothetical protein